MPWARPRAACAPAWGGSSRWPRTTRSSRPTKVSSSFPSASAAWRTGSPIAASLYNEAVNLNNVRIEQFPDLLIARVAGFKAAELLQFSEAEKADVDLKALFG